MLYALGKKPARLEAVKLKFGAYFNTAQLPAVPVRFGHPELIRDPGMLANDSVGDCVWAGAAHETMLLRAAAGFAPPPFKDENVLADYAACAGYNPADESTDQGTDLQQAASYRRKTGIIDANGERHKIDIYAALEPGNLEQIALAVVLFGCVGIGVNLPSSAEEQFTYGEPWSFVSGDKPVGGHYIPLVGRNSLGNFLIVSWGRLHACTPKWLESAMDEGLAYISLERLNAKGLSPQGYNEAALRDDFAQVTRT